MDESNNLIGLGLIGVLVYALWQRQSQIQPTVVTNWPTQTQGPIITQSPVPVINPYTFSLVFPGHNQTPSGCPPGEIWVESFGGGSYSCLPVGAMT